MPLTVHATLQQVPPDHKGGYSLETQPVSAEADSYEEGLAACERLVPEGWRIIHISVDRPGDVTVGAL